MKKSVMVLCLSAAALLVCSPACRAQGGATKEMKPGTLEAGIDQDIQMLRQDIRSNKKQMIAENLRLTEAEATKFWPVYDQFAADLAKINDEKYSLVKEYINDWGKIGDDQALKLTNREMAVEQRIADLRAKYVSLFNKVLPGTKVATYYQIERRIQALIDLRLGSQLLLVQSQNQ